MESFNVGVIGSRGFKDYDYLEKKLSDAPFTIGKIISGGAVGADRFAIKYAKRHDIVWEEFLPNHKAYRHPYHHRNRLIAEASDVVIAFWDGRSTGTKYTIDYAKKIGKRVVIFKF
jgi:predicted Rossmann fold nucleotide-binding protein DprA/Smf involved in DNA uptake